MIPENKHPSINYGEYWSYPGNQGWWIQIDESYPPVQVSISSDLCWQNDDVEIDQYDTTSITLTEAKALIAQLQRDEYERRNNAD